MRAIASLILATLLVSGASVIHPERIAVAEEVSETITVEYWVAGIVHYTEHVYDGPVHLRISGVVTRTTPTEVEQSDAFYSFPPPIFRQDGQGVLWINGQPPSIDLYVPAYNPDHVYEVTLDVSHSKLDFWLGNREYGPENEFSGALTVTITGTVSDRRPDDPIPAPEPPTAAGEPIADPAFFDTWARTDGPVMGGQVVRTWMWGMGPFTGSKWEPYVEAANGERLVQYFDKTRMEITHPDGDSESIWYVTNGLLVVELMTGQVQTGDRAREVRSPAEVNVAGDPGTGPTYATLGTLRHAVAAPEGSAITQHLHHDGSVTNDASLATFGVTAAYYAPDTDHSVASPFWTFMNSTGRVYDDGFYVTDDLFDSPFYATGYPITEAYWAEVMVAGEPASVLLQCFERRCLTYTPGNPAEWQVEAGNVGWHYYTWRHGSISTAASSLSTENR